jgi:hypothetical protein
MKVPALKCPDSSAHFKAAVPVFRVPDGHYTRDPAGSDKRELPPDQPIEWRPEKCRDQSKTRDALPGEAFGLPDKGGFIRPTRRIKSLNK